MHRKTRCGGTEARYTEEEEEVWTTRVASPKSGIGARPSGLRVQFQMVRQFRKEGMVESVAEAGALARLVLEHAEHQVEQLACVRMVVLHVALQRRIFRHTTYKRKKFSSLLGIFIL